MTSSPMRRSISVFLVLLLVVATTACTGRRGNRGGRDGVDLGMRGDAGSDDAGSVDLGSFDLGSLDLGGFDLGFDAGRDLGSDPGGDGELRLGPGGLLEVYYMGQWGTVCDDSFDDLDAQVACRQLGYPSGTWMPASVPGTGEIFMDDIACTGTEARLANCVFSGWAVHNCSHSEDVALTCGGAAP